MVGVCRAWASRPYSVWPADRRVVTGDLRDYLVWGADVSERQDVKSLILEPSDLTGLDDVG
jgi:hypothetical protein